MKEMIEEIRRRAKQFGSELLARFADAFQNTLDLEGTPDVPNGYAMSLFTSHLAGSKGSEFLGDSPSGLCHLLFADYGSKWEKFTPMTGSAIPGCEYFQVLILNVGKMGSRMLKTFDPNEKVVVRKNHAGKFELNSNGQKLDVNDVTICLGPCGGKEVVYCLHPGVPLPPGDVSEGVTEGQELTVGEAIQLGFKVVKYN